jgi:hypothetical protein
VIRRLLKTLLQYIQAPAARSAGEFGNAIEEELTFHIGERTRELVEGGMSEEDAKRAAIARFGDPSRVAAECHATVVGGLAMWHRLHLAMTALLAVAVMALSCRPASRLCWTTIGRETSPVRFSMIRDGQSTMRMFSSS